MKLTRKQRGAIEEVLLHAERAAKYLFSPRIAIARVSSVTFATTTLDFTRQSDGRVLYEVEKEYGSDLTGLPAAIRHLQAILKPTTR